MCLLRLKQATTTTKNKKQKKLFYIALNFNISPEIILLVETEIESRVLPVFVSAHISLLSYTSTLETSSTHCTVEKETPPALGV